MKVYNLRKKLVVVLSNKFILSIKVAILKFFSEWDVNLTENITEIWKKFHPGINDEALGYLLPQ